MTTLREYLLILGVFAIAAVIWLKPPPVINISAEYLIVNQEGGDVELHKWESQAPIKIKIPELKKIDIPPEVK